MSDVRHVGNQIDEIVSENLKKFHLEKLNAGAWWVGLESHDGTVEHVMLSAKRGAKIEARYEKYRGDVVSTPIKKIDQDAFALRGKAHKVSDDAMNGKVKAVEREVQVDSLWRHVSGEIYRVKSVALGFEDLSAVIVCQKHTKFGPDFTCDAAQFLAGDFEEIRYEDLRSSPDRFQIMDI